MELYKGKGPTSVIESYRDITLADMNGKCFGSFVRCCIFVAVQAFYGKSQNGGGLNSASTDLCLLQVTQVFVAARVLKKAAGVLFVDLVTAFASVSRCIAIPGLPESEEQWLRHLVGMGIQPEEASCIMNCALSILEYNAAGVSEHGVALLRETHKTSWFSTDGLKHVC